MLVGQPLSRWGQQKPPLGTPVNTGHALSIGLSAAYLLNEGGGLTAKDATGNGNDGTLTGSISWKPARTGYGLSDNGTGGNYVNLTNATFPFTTGASFAAWVRLNSFGTGCYVFSCRPDNTGFSAFGVWVNGSGQLAFECRTTTGQLLTNTSATVSPNAWQHVCLTFSSGTVTYYVNGKSAGTKSTSGTSLSQTGSGVGLCAFGTGGVPMNGLMDTALVYNRALTAAEVQRLYLDPFALFVQPGRLPNVITSPATGPHTYNESMSGGILGGGTATTAATYAPTVTAAGVIAAGAAVTGIAPALSGAGVVVAGTATNKATYNPASGTDGPLAGSSATTAATYAPAVSPAGVVTAGAAVPGIGPYIAPSGVYASGTATTAATYNPYLTPAGALAGSSATTAATYAPAVSPAGALANGTATNTEIDNLDVTPAGVVTSGTAPASATYFPSLPTSGPTASGAAASSATYNPAPVPGALAAGAAPITATYFPALPLAGAWAAGSGQQGFIPNGTPVSRCPFALSKLPGESRTYSFDFGSKMELQNGDTLADVISLTAFPDDLTLGPATISGSAVQATLGGGTPGTTYGLRVYASTQSGAVIGGEGRILVQG